MSKLAKDIVAAIAPALAAHVPPLRAEFVTSQDLGVDDEIALVAEDGRRHLVGVQVGANYAMANLSGYETKELGDGLRSTTFAWSRQGAPNEGRDAAGKAAAALAALLRSHPGAFEPTPGPGVGGHPHLAAIVNGMRSAVTDSGGSTGPGGSHVIAINPVGAPADGDDVVTLDAADGTSVAAAMTMNGGFSFLDPDTGVVIEAVYGERAEALAKAFVADALLAASAPTP